jgi:hypothetical protein
MASPSPVGQAFSVDDNGPADFVGIDVAIASPLVAAGDTLLVADGTYPGFTLTKALHIQPVPGQSYTVSGPVLISGVPYFSLVGAQLWTLVVQDVPGRGVIDRCSVSHGKWGAGLCYYQDGHTQFERCDELLVQRSDFRGFDADYDTGPACPDSGATIIDCVITMTDCDLRGGDPQGAFECNPHYPCSGQGLTISQSSRVFLAGTTVEAGDSGGTPEPAISIQGSTLVIRGNSTDLLSSSNATIAPIQLDAASTVFTSGVVLAPPLLPPTVSVPSPAEPFMLVTDGQQPGSDLHVHLFGPAGVPAMVGASIVPGRYAQAIVSEDLWFGPAGLFALWPLTTAGQELESGFQVGLPWDPVLIGLPVIFQSWVDPSGGGGPWLTNAFQVVLGA